MKTLLIVCLLTSLFAGCNKVGFQGATLDPTVAGGSGNRSAPSTTVSSITKSGNQLIVNGSGFETVDLVKLSGASVNTILTIASRNSSQMVLDLSQNITVLAGATFNLLIGNAYGSTTYQITFSLDANSITTAMIQDGAITASKLAQMGATSGQYLKYNGTNWIPSSLPSSLSYQGAYNATTNVPDIDSLSHNSGYFYIASNNGTQNINGVSTSIHAGDWILSDGSTWNVISDSAYRVQSFKGRTGVVVPLANDYTWAMIDKASSKLEDIADIDITSRQDNYVLSWNAGTSKYEFVALPSPGTTITSGSITSTEIASNTITDSNISSSANISMSKISGLSSALTGKEDAITSGTTSQYFRGDKTWQTLNTSNVSEGSNLYFTDARARSALEAYTFYGLTFPSGVNSFQTTQTPSLPNDITNKTYVDGELANKENTITSGTTSQYFRGDKTWQTLNTTNVSEGSNLYFTNARAVGATISAPTLTNTAIASGDSVQTVAGKLQAQINSQATSISGKEGSIASGTTSQYFRGDKTWQTLNTSNVSEGSNLYFTNSRVLSSTLDGFVNGTNSPIDSTDTVLTAFGKIETRLAATGPSPYTKVDSSVIRLGGSAYPNYNESNLTGDTSIVIGGGASYNSSGSFPLDNISIGWNSLSGNINGTRNVSVGYNSGLNLTSGYSVAIGAFALGGLDSFENTPSFPNSNGGLVAIGSFSSAKNTGAKNTTVGAYSGSSGAGFTSSSFSDSTLVGYKAGYNMTSGGYNTVLGAEALTGVTTGIDNIAIGYRAMQTGTGASSTNIIIGNNAFNNAYTNTKDNNIFLGHEAGRYLRTASNNIVLGNGSSLNTMKPTETGNIIIGHGSNTSTTSYTNAIVIGSGINPIGDNTISIGSSSHTTTTLNGGASAANALVVGTTTTNGNGAYLTKAGVWTNISDKRVKENIKDLDYSLDTLLKIKPVRYTMKGTKEKQIGFIAQDLYKVVPEVVTKPVDEKVSRWGVSYGNLVSLVVKAIQELDKIVKDLFKTTNKHEIEIKRLQKENEILKARLDQLEKKLSK